MAHTLDHIVALRLEADPSLAVDHPDYEAPIAPIALGDYELPDFSVPPPLPHYPFWDPKGYWAEARARARAPPDMTGWSPEQIRGYEIFREITTQTGAFAPREREGEGLIAGGLEYISNIPGEIGEAAGEFVSGLGGGVGAGLGALTAPIVAAPGALLEGIPSWVPLLGAAYLLTRN